MIKKVSSWVLGSFFRQFGRFLFFLVLGVLVVLLAQHNNINFKLTDLLGIETIKADTIQPLGFEFKGEDGNTLSQLYGAPPYVRGYSFNQNSDTASGTLPFYLNADKSYYMYSNFDYALINLYAYIENQRQNYDSSISGINIQNEKVQGLTFYVEMITNGTWSQCNLENSATNGSGNYVMYTIKCPKAKNVTGIQKFNIQYNYYNQSIGSDLVNVKLGMSYSINFITGDSASIIDNQNQNHNDTMEFFNDSNTTSSVDTTTNFFNDTNITVEQPLTTIVSTPFTLLNNLSTGVYNGICATLNGKQICLPSGQIIWSGSSSGGSHGGGGQHDNYNWFRGGTTENFISFFNLVVGGYLLYRCLLGLFKTLHKMLDPTSSHLEVMDL